MGSNLNTTPKAIKTWAHEKNKTTFEELGIFSREETEARAEVMYEAYNTTLSVEANTMVDMIRNGILPACARDLAIYKDAPVLVGGRAKLYEALSTETDKLAALLKAAPHDMVAEADHFCNTVKPQMEGV